MHGYATEKSFRDFLRFFSHISPTIRIFAKKAVDSANKDRDHKSSLNIVAIESFRVIMQDEIYYSFVKAFG